MLRAFALTIPAVTVELRSKGLPTASTHSPGVIRSESPYLRKGRFLARIFNKARSVVGSLPISWHKNAHCYSSLLDIIGIFNHVVIGNDVTIIRNNYPDPEERTGVSK